MRMAGRGGDAKASADGVIIFHALAFRRWRSAKSSASRKVCDRSVQSRSPDLRSRAPRGMRIEPSAAARRRSVAQWLEHRSPKPGVGGSSPSTPATKIGHFWHSTIGSFRPLVPFRAQIPGASFRARSCAAAAERHRGNRLVRARLVARDRLDVRPQHRRRIVPEPTGDKIGRQAVADQV